MTAHCLRYSMPLAAPLAHADHLKSHACAHGIRLPSACRPQIQCLYNIRADAGASRDGFSNGPWLPRAGSFPSVRSTTLPDGLGAAATAAAAAGGTDAAQQYELRGLSAAPWDWSLKTRLRISSSQPFACLQAAAAAGLLPACRAACRGGGVSTSGGGATAALAERLHGALLQWQHPSAALGPDALQLMRASKATADLLTVRLRAWRDTLRGLIAAVRNGQCTAAYVAGAQVRGQGTTGTSARALRAGAACQLCSKCQGRIRQRCWWAPLQQLQGTKPPPNRSTLCPLFPSPAALPPAAFGALPGAGRARRPRRHNRPRGSGITLQPSAAPGARCCGRRLCHGVGGRRWRGGGREQWRR
jgi:hypothetical protein